MKLDHCFILIVTTILVMLLPEESLCQEESEQLILSDDVLAPRVSMLDSIPIAATERLDLFPALRTFIRVLRMINRRDALERIRDAASKILVRRGHTQSSGLASVATNKFKKVKMLRRLISIVGHRDKNSNN
jgi:hypothetical protein